MADSKEGAGHGAVKRSEHEAKFDRQLRLWGFHGQRRLENAHVLVLGANPTGSEALKNLVLPNLAHFTLVDGQKVHQSDLGNNFFVSPESLGSSRAEVVTQLILELNPSVQGTAVSRDVSELITSESVDFFRQYDMVIACGVSEAGALRLDSLLYPAGIPLLLLRTNGLIGYARLVVREHQIVESHAENDRLDLGVHPAQLALWPEWRDFLMGFDTNVADLEEHSHVPFPALLAQHAARWMSEHEGRLPRARDEVELFKRGIRRASRTGLNYDEAVNMAFHAYVDPNERIDPLVRAVLDDPAVDASHEEFWVMVWGLREFIRTEGQGFFPIVPVLPDMTTFPRTYVAVKALFDARARKDLAAIRTHVQTRCRELGRAAEVSEENLEIFVRNARKIRVERMRSLAAEYGGDADFKEAITEAMGDPDEDEAGPSNVPLGGYWYAALRAAEAFREAEGRYPGEKIGHSDAEVGPDVERLRGLAERLLGAWGLGEKAGEVTGRVCAEVARYGGSQVHNVGALMGAIAGQACLKLVTKQYVPFNNTVVYCGIHCNVDRLQL